ncbi:hypothetical protein ASPSYDRAFT_61946 [Aspergillus sydowii CBS 593.65]|uniref:Uncharacterized protein n=1 Tax=Aspergillus sydowii CBS 593.65 TaxID=1036612 RepID=A0A1L9T1V9_9EURO|nr:uncharacterized protein ASPSYDRAFT_61946 [Aspergillus sydowii CBS 593.65]OJJ53283.1 hypothetical protein ASPSYDRAFT_61946 [Aspergillus sydowii CBS 593.65]
MSQPVSTTRRKPRRFLPEPIETSSRSSNQHRNNDHAEQYVRSSHEAIRIFEFDNSSPTEGRTPCGHSSQLWQIGQAAEPPRRSSEHVYGSTSPETVHTTLSTPNSRGKEQRTRRFTPQLMETARHSFSPRKKPFNHDGFSRLEAETRSLRNSARSRNRVQVNADVLQESRFSYSSLMRRQESRRHSFRVPDLPAIPSSGSEESSESNTPRLPCSPSQPSSCEPNIGQEPSFLEYILIPPTDASESQLKEQALAAFPNEQVYQPVDHFAIDKDEEPSYEDSFDMHEKKLMFRISRRASSADLPSELEYLRRHKEEAGMNRRHYLTTRGEHNSHAKTLEVVNRDDGWDISRSLTQLRQTASPPMLGNDLEFPQSLTPESTICEGNHITGSNLDQTTLSSSTGLWCSNPQFSVGPDSGGLWNGTCKPNNHDSQLSKSLLPGLVTPNHGFEETQRVLDESYWAGPPHPCHQNSNIAIRRPRDDARHDESYNQEFDDRFVTQIYDYLSLGYPSVARYYDHELSKVSGLPVAKLRADDLNTDAKGHVGVHAVTYRSETNGLCMRWTALRLYIHEWVRQHPQMSEEGHDHETWGVRERKGSWAV